MRVNMDDIEENYRIENNIRKEIVDILDYIDSNIGVDKTHLLLKLSIVKVIIDKLK